MSIKARKSRSAGTDYASYRYGLSVPSKVRMPRILAGQERQMVESHVKEILRSWESSPFEFEGACRHGVRSQLCLVGHRWPHADFEASLIVSEGLQRIGAHRPSWREGQPEHTQEGFSPTQRTHCAHCDRPIPQERIDGTVKDVLYCSNRCGQAAYATKARAFGETTSRAEYLALQAARARATREAEIDCEHCGKPFRPGYNIKRRRFCSPECRGAHRTAVSLARDAARGRGRYLTVRCTCVACGSTFYSREDRKYCSRECYHTSQRQIGRQRPARQCPACHTIFQANSPKNHSACCSRTCAWVLRRAGAKHEPPLNIPEDIAAMLTVGSAPRLSPMIFDHFVGLPALAAASQPSSFPP